MSTSFGDLGGGSSGEAPPPTPEIPSEYAHLDLDVRNYSLQELLNLLQLPVGFDDRDLRRAMRQVVRLHPDKSNAPPEVYRLFYEAHVICRQLLSARTQGALTALVREDYDTPEGRKIAEDMTIREDFGKWFNESFEEFHKTLPDKMPGYQEWLKEGGDGAEFPQSGDPEQMMDELLRRRTAADEHLSKLPKFDNRDQMIEEMMRRRQEAAKKAVVLADGPMPANTGGGTMLLASEETPLSMTGGMVGDIGFGDLKSSYENSIVAVGAIDEMGVNGDSWAPPVAKSIEELQRERAMLDAESAAGWKSFEEERAAFDEAQRKLLRESTDARMYALQQEQHEQMEAHKRWQAANNRLTNGWQ